VGGAGPPARGRALPGGAGLPGGSSLRAAMNAGIPLTETPAVARPLPMPRAAAVYAQAAQQMPPVQLTGAAQLPGDLSIRPVAGRITSRMGERVDPVDGSHSHHRGVDLAAKVGTPVHSAGPGRVVRAGEASGYGNLVVVDHGDGVETRYAHLDRIDVRVGDTLAAGQALGAAGATGRVTGPHLHFEVRKDGEALDPVAFLKQAAPVTGVTPGGGGAHGATHLPDAAQPVVTTPKESSLKSSRQWTTHSGGGK
jgi:murein DD-endopeptidase MepM/ murein hydrolase activator NlpD